MNILIVGKSSYIGTHAGKWLKKHGHNIYTLNSRTDEWATYDYSGIDSIIHVAAVVHQKQVVPWEVFYEINTVLPVSIATKAKKAGVKQFVFLSTMGVYGSEKELPNGSIIDEETTLNPTSYYGKSKKEAEKRLVQLEDESYHISIIRPPSVYGKNCPGNYVNGFKNIAKYFPIFPKAYSDVRQSFLYIDNLSELIRLIIETNSPGIYIPQDSTQPSTTQLVELMASLQGKKVRMSYSLGKIIKLFSKWKIIKKLYGGIRYTSKNSLYFEGKYRKVDFTEGMKRTLS